MQTPVNSRPHYKSPWQPQQTTNIDRFTAKMSDAEIDVAIDVVPTKKRERWDREDEAALIELVLEREGVLFGYVKGVCHKGISKRRTESWEEIAVVLNS